jgi:hypothetical protein
VSPTALYRLAGQTGVVAAVLLLFNDARRAGIVPENTFTHSIAPVAAFLALFVITGWYLWQRESSGVLGLWGYLLNFVGLSGALAIEFTLHYVFPLLDKQTVTRLVEGRTGTGFLIVSVVYLTGIVLFGLAMWRAGRFPRPAVALYVVGFVPTALRSVVPDFVVTLAFVAGSVAVIWLSVSLVLAVARTAASAVSPARIPNTAG